MKEIEITFSLRHPHIIGLYAWFKIAGVLTQFGMVLELAHSDLRSCYKEENFTLEIGLKIVLGVAKGLAYMHTMPEPVVHRDVKVGAADLLLTVS